MADVFYKLGLSCARRFRSYASAGELLAQFFEICAHDVLSSEVHLMLELAILDRKLIGVK